MRFLWWAPIALLVLSSVARTSGQEDPELLAELEANGTRLIRRHAYMASLRDLEGNHFCTGALINQQHVMTAAHCLDPLAFSRATRNPVVHIGVFRTDEVDEKAMVRKSIKTEFHPQYSGVIEEGYDVAILILESPVDAFIEDDEDAPGGTSSKPFPFLRMAFPGIQESTARIEPGAYLALTAYGRVSSQAGFSAFLERASLKFIPNEECNMPDRRDGAVLQNQMCAGDTPGAPCLGDEGAPLIKLSDARKTRGDLAVGLVSLINDPCESGEPVIFTRIFYEPIRQWIDSIISAPVDG